MTCERQTRLVAGRFIEAIRNGDRVAMDGLLSDDAEWWVLGKGALDRKDFLSAVDPDRPKPVSARRDIVSLTVEDDRAAIEIDLEIVWTQGVYRNQCHHLIVVKGDLIISFREYLDHTASRDIWSITLTDDVQPVSAAA